MINIQNIDDNECFKWCLVRYLHPADHNSRRITKVDKSKYPIYVPKKFGEEKHVDLLLYCHKFLHFCRIKFRGSWIKANFTGI